MGESESAQQSKKRAAVKELSRDNPGLDDEEDSAELESGTFKRASDEVLANRRIVRIKRKEAPATAPSSNPFAAIRLVPPTEPAVETKSTPAEATSKTVDEGEKPAADDQRTDAAKDSEGIKDDNSEAIGSGKDAEVESNKVNDKETVESKVEDAAGEVTEKAKEESDNQVSEAAGDPPTDNCNTVKETDQTGGSNEKEAAGDQTKNGREDENGSENVEKNGDGALSSFQQHSSTKNAFTGLVGTGFSSSSFSFSSVSQEGSTGSGSLFGQSAGQTTFSFGLSNNGNSSLFGKAGTPIITKSESSAFPSKEEVSVETGEENERVAFSADSVLFEFLDGAWKERGKGEIKINVSTCGNGKARLLMRARGNYRLILNAGLFPEMKLTNMDKKGITFACVNSIGEDKDGLSTFALKFKDPTFVEEFRAAVMQNQDGKPVEAAPLKTPENSPRAADA